MRLSAICAMSQNRVIGKDNQLPWRLPADLRHFKKITTGHPIILGRKTFESIGRALPDRCNVVLTRDVDFAAPGCVVVNSIQTALSAVSYSDEAFVIGGALLYQQILPKVQRLYLTEIHQDFEGDAFFPELDKKDWHEMERIPHGPDEENPYSYSFVILERIV
jgi:dihydrofolate reductase